MATKPLQIYLTDTEKQILRDASDRERRSLSSFIVIAALQAAKNVTGVENECVEGEAQ